MAKSPNGKIIKLLNLKIAYVWTRPWAQNNYLNFISRNSIVVAALI